MRQQAESRLHSRAASRKGSQTELVPAAQATEAHSVGINVGDLEKGLRGSGGTEGFPVVGGAIDERLEMVEQIKEESTPAVTAATEQQEWDVVDIRAQH